MKATHRPTQRFPRRASTLGAALALLAAVGPGCAATPDLSSGGSLGAVQVAQQLSAAQTINGVRISFNYADYYSLTLPNAEGCAGDARNFYDPVALTVPGSTLPSYGFDASGGQSVTGLSVAVGATGSTGPMLLPQDVTASDQTIRPSFIKNISVDMTDANANISSNKAAACSLGQGNSVPATSSCATFDYGAIGGIPSTLGGTMLVIGGVQNLNYSGILPAGLQSMLPSQGMSLGCGPVVNPYTSPSTTNYTQCYSGVYALGVDTLPASAFVSNPSLMPGYIGSSGPTGAVSMWANLSAAPAYSGPLGGAGGSATYDPGLQKVLLFGGAAPQSAFVSSAPGVTTYDTWLMDLKSQTWNLLTANIFLDSKITNLFDLQLDIESPAASVGSNFGPTPQQIPKSILPRGIFGYVATPGMGVLPDQLNSSGAMSAAMIDPTDRLMIIGGYGQTVYTGVHRFNPTYGPEIQNMVNVGNVGTTSLIDISTAPEAPLPFSVSGSSSSANLPVQWVDSYHTQLLNNTYGKAFTATNTNATAGLPYTELGSIFAPDLPPLDTGPQGGQQVINTAFAPISNNDGAIGIMGTGYILGAGGFDFTATNDTTDSTSGDSAAHAGCTTDGNVVASDFSNTTQYCGGGLSVMTRYYTAAAGGAANESNTSDWSAIPDFQDTNTMPASPALWTQITETTELTAPSGNGQNVPFVGGASMLPGFNLKDNDVVFFGGVDCRDYISDTTATCNFNTNPGIYWRFTTNPINTLDPAGPIAPALTSKIPADTISNGWVGSMNAAPTGSSYYAPRKAGMATARGLDPAGNVIILAWGGAKAGATVEGFNRIYYLVNSGSLTSPVPEWGYASPSGGTVTGDVPTELINAAMVFSHVTHKFYVFGGYDPSVQTSSGDTYEISVVSANNVACSMSGSPTATTGTCSFVWRRLDQPTGTGLICYPSSCPSARRSHRMAEVNYYNRNPGGINGSANGEQTCSANAPCSYGIFMEGGTTDGFNFLNDRWMFDPTANGGAGEWQQMGELPPRALAALASVDYTLPVNGQAVHRAILFGGETGLHNPEWAPTGSYLVAPTLGDTWMFDYDNQSWNRVRLLGRGYNGSGQIPNAASGGGTEFDRRQSYNAGTDAGGYGSFASASDLGVKATEFSPPPLSGAVMVTRTLAPQPLGSTDTQLRTLSVPEVYLFGGRMKDGSFSTLDRVYKFCAGTTGEAFTLSSPSDGTNSIPDPNDYVCDGYDATYNIASPSPVIDYVGRWLTKEPDAYTAGGSAFTPAGVGSYLGAGAYDPTRDRIVLFGGLNSGALPTSGCTPSSPANCTAVTDTSHLFASPFVYEYTPPQPQLASASPVSSKPREGRWTFVPACAGPQGAPSGRYGHSLAFNQLGGNIILMGGYDATGTPITRQIFDPSTQSYYSAPDVWTGTYCDNTGCDGKLKGSYPDLDLTNAPCYFWQPMEQFGNSTAIQSQLPPETGLAHAATVFVPATGFNSGYYSMFDSACAGEGPIAEPDPSVNKLLAGGAYIDIDRSALGANENLLLNITYIPMGVTNTNPDDTPVTLDQSAVFRVHLIKTGQTQQQLEAALQPRYMVYSDTQQFPEVVQSLAVMAPPTGQIAQEQIMVPLSLDPGIDRIRIERYSGSGILLDASLYRMGSK